MDLAVFNFFPFFFFVEKDKTHRVIRFTGIKTLVPDSFVI